MKRTLWCIPFFIFVPLSFLVAQSNTGNDLALRLERHVSFLASDSLEGRGLGTEGKKLAKQYIAEQFASIGLESFSDSYYQHFDMRIGLARVPGTNIAGYIAGSDPSLRDEYIVIGAHYDHLGYEYEDQGRVVYPGADDNASGVAVMIELARNLSACQPGRSVLFVAFDAEESGLLGSEVFVSEKDVALNEQIKLMFSLDMVGMYSANGGLDAIGIGTLDGGRELAGVVASDYNIHIRRATSEIAVRTDTRPFANLGIPAVHIYTGTNSPYHKPEDSYDLLDYEGMALITEFLTNLVSELSVAPDLLPSRRFERAQHPFGLTLSAGITGGIGASGNVYPDEFFDAKRVFSFSSGLFARVKVGQKFALQPELLYDFNGSKSTSGNFRRHSLTVPLNLNVYLAGDEGGIISAFPFGGVYYRYTFAGNSGQMDAGLNTLHPSGEWGVSFGFGLEILKFNLSYTFRRGFTDISDNPETTVYNSGSFLTFGYRF